MRRLGQLGLSPCTTGTCLTALLTLRAAPRYFTRTGHQGGGGTGRNSQLQHLNGVVKQLLEALVSTLASRTKPPSRGCARCG